jgi:hypothetical protein
VDGPGEKNGGRELCISDLREQVSASAELIRALRPEMVAIVKGSRYHVGKAIFLEDLLAEELGIPTPLWENRFRFAGKVFSVRHKISKTALPHTSFTPLARDCDLDLRRSARAEQEKTDVLIRAHVHKFVQLQFDGILAITLPGMQFESDYGNAECNGVTDVGFVELEIGKEGDIICTKHQIPPKLYARPIVDVTPQCWRPRAAPATNSRPPSGRSRPSCSKLSPTTRTASRPKT